MLCCFGFRKTFEFDFHPATLSYFILNMFSTVIVTESIEYIFSVIGDFNKRYHLHLWVIPVSEYEF